MGEDFHQDHAIRLPAAEDRQQIVIAERIGYQVERIASFLAAQCSAGDDAVRWRVEILGEMQGNEMALAGTQLLPGQVRRKALLLDQL